VSGIDRFLSRVLQQELQYPSPVAEALQSGFVTPAGEESTWDGWIQLYHQPKTMLPWFPTGLLPKAKYLAEKYRYQVEVDDQREKPELGFPEPMDLQLRDYQKLAVKLALDGQSVLPGRGVFDMVPRAGKTRTALELLRILALPALWIAPTDRIVRQTQEVVEKAFGKHFCLHLVGARSLDAAQYEKVPAGESPSVRAKRVNKLKKARENLDRVGKTNVVICTAATAVRLPKAFYATRKVLLTDEFHHGAAKSYKEIFDQCGHIYYRYGMTGTFFRSGDDDMAMHALLSEPILRVTSADLLARGFLVPTQVAFLPVLAPRLMGMPPGFITGHGKYGIHEHDYRNNLATYAAVTLHQCGRKVLVLVGTKKQGRTLQKMISAYLPQPQGTQFKRVEFVSTDIDRKRQTKILEAYLDTDEVQILIGTSLLGEGVDLPSVDALVYAKGEKAEVSLTQSAYRVCTAIAGKKDAVIVDFADRHNAKLLRHSKERLAVYHHEDTFDVSVLQDPTQFGDWLRQQGLGGAPVSSEGPAALE